MKKKEMHLTSVKVEEELFQKFRISCIKNKFSLQKLVERGVHLYLNDPDFKRMITSMKVEF